MKKLLFTLLLIMFIMPITVFAAEKVEIKSIELINKSDNTVIVEEASTDGEKIDLNVVFYEKNDYVTYKVLVKNNSNKSLFINDHIFKNDNEHISYVFMYDDGNNFVKPGKEKVVNIKVVYSNKVDKELFRNAKYDASNKNPLLLSDKIIKVQNTLKNIGIFGILTIVFTIICIAMGLIQINKNKRINPMNLLILLSILLFMPKTASALLQVEIPIDSKITIKNVKPNYCYFDGNLTQGTQYINGQYTYRYKQTYYSAWNNINEDGWGVTLTDKESTDPVTTPICTYINDKPIVSMTDLFYYSNTTSIDLSSFDTSNVINIDYIFEGAKNVESLDLSTFDTSHINSFYSVFKGMTSLKSLDLRYFDFYSGYRINSYSGYRNVYTSNMIYNCTSLESINFKGVKFASGVELGSMGINTTKITELDFSDCTFVDSMNNFFYNLEKVESVNLSNVNTEEVSNFGNLFYSSKKIKSLDLSSFNTSKVTNMSSLYSMFYGTDALEYLNISNFDFSNIGYSGYLGSNLSFKYSPSLKTIDASNIKVKGSMAGAFSELPAVETILLTNVDTSKVTNMEQMFYNSKKLRYVDFSSSNFIGVTSLNQMFTYCYDLKEVKFGSMYSLLAADNMNYMLDYLDNYDGGFDLSTLIFRGSNTRLLTSDPKLSWVIAPKTIIKRENFLPSYFYDANYNKYTHLTLVHHGTKVSKIDNKHVITYRLNGGKLDTSGKLLELDDNHYGELPVPTREGRVFKGWSLSDPSYSNPTLLNSESTFSISAHNDSYYPVNKILYAIWEKPSTYLVSGSTFNSRIKYLATNGNVSSSTTDVNTIKHIKKANSAPDFEFTSDNVVSDYNSTNKVYAWFDDDTIYIYSPNGKIYLNADSSNIFRNLSGLLDIDLSMFDFSDVVYFDYAFYYDTSLTSLDLSNYSFDSCLSFRYSFNSCSNLNYLNIKSLNLLYTDSANMITGSYNLKDIVAPYVASLNYPSYLPDTPGRYVKDDEGIMFEGLTSGMEQGKTYKQVKYYVYFYNTGDISYYTKVLPYDSTKYGKLPTPTNGNKIFKGWYYGSSTSDELITSESELPTNTTYAYLYARWEDPE